MAAREGQIGLALMGSVFLGIWLYGLLFSFDPLGGETQDLGRWFGWGVVGLVMATAGYGIRALTGVSQLSLMILLGVLSTVVIMGAMLNENTYIFATLCSGVGAGLVAAALPPPRPQGHAARPAWKADDAERVQP